LSYKRDSLSEKKKDKTKSKAKTKKTKNKTKQDKTNNNNKTKTMKQIYFSDMFKIPDDCFEARLVHIKLNVTSASFS